tara:strand:- start:15 stop:182 length:168 start_codon:yes stop_codon:yes gene_type:complete
MKIWGLIFPIINAYAWVVVLFVLDLPLACGVYEQEWQRRPVQHASHLGCMGISSL